ncbi:MAG: hypothetical protein ACI92S_005139, partial [Planctomycetaceae bacterium]
MRISTHGTPTSNEHSACENGTESVGWNKLRAVPAIVLP